MILSAQGDPDDDDNDDNDDDDDDDDDENYSDDDTYNNHLSGVRRHNQTFQKVPPQWSTRTLCT